MNLDIEKTEAVAKSSQPSPLSLEVRENGVAIVRYDVPGEAVNTLKTNFAEELAAMVDRIEGTPEIRAAVLVSGKEDTWIAGADIEMLKAAKTAAEAETMCRFGHRAIGRLRDCQKPIVAAIHGAALGGGFEVALACRARVASKDKKTVFAFPEVKLGLLPALHGLQRLAQLAGLQVALDYGLTGKSMYPDKARVLGVVDDVVPRSILESVAVQVALDLADGKSPKPPRRKKSLGVDVAAVSRWALEDTPPGRALLFKKAREQVAKTTGGHYPAPVAILKVLETFGREGFESSVEVEAHEFGDLVASETARNLMGLFFATNSLKKDSGVDDHAVQAREVTRVGVLGAGLMGAGIAYVTTEGDMFVRLKDRDDASLGKGVKYVAEIIDERVKRRQMTRIEREEQLAYLSTTTDYSGFRSVELVIEAVFEDLSIKHRVLREVVESGGPNVIFASNTSALPIGRIAEASSRPQNVVGMHYFSPVHKMPLLEVIRTSQTADEVVATAVAVGKRQGKTVIVVNDGVGFYTTRVLGPYLNEASYLLTEGLSVETIDEAMLAWGFPVGPLRLIDEVGIDVGAHVAATLREAFGERIAPPASFEKLLQDDRKGRKNKRGFYVYDDAAKSDKQVDSSVYGALGLPTPSGEQRARTLEIQERCALQLVNEAMYCLGEGVLRSARDGDVGAIFGLGFPPFRGGPFRYVDEVGADRVLRTVEGYHDRFGARWAPAPSLVEAAKSGRKFEAR